MPVRILCDCAELAVEALRAAELIGWQVETEIAGDPIAAALAADSSNPLGIAQVAAPTLEQLVALGHRRLPKLTLAMLERSHTAARLRDVALDLGITAVTDVAPLLAALRLLHEGAEHPWAASLRALPEPDRARMRMAQTQGARSGASFVSGERGAIAFATGGSGAAFELGRASDVAAAVAALRDTDRATLRIEASVDGVDSKAVLDVLFGPRRALSDPASKSALMPYGIPLPTEELCASASRAAVEAGRIGFPVRISLASPDLRVWDHADLSVDMVDNAARVRDTFRQLMGLAKARLVTKPNASSAASTTLRPPSEGDVVDRVLGVMVTATAESRALLGARAWPLPEGRVAMEISFADAHGSAADDRTLLVMPATAEQIERALERLAGHSLILGTVRSERRAHLEAIADVLHRLSAFVHDRRREVTSVELRPLALLLDGTIEVREACVTVSDAFERMLYTPPTAQPA
jgi:hypothetical protein